MKRFTGVMMVAALAAGLVAGCKPSTETAKSPEGAAKPKVVLGVSLLTMANPFFKDMADSMQQEAKKYGYEVIVTAGEMDPSRQKDQVGDFIVKKVNAIILAPCDSKSIGTSIQEANKAGIPVFTADIACLDKNAKVVTHVATDNYSGGKLAGEAMVKLLGGKGKVAIIDHPEVESVILRTKGFREVVSKSPGIQIVAQLPGGGARDVSFKTAQDILEKNPDLQGIFAINDPSALGAVAALEKAGRKGKVKVVGFDGQPEAKQAVKDGKIDADAIQFPDKIGVGVVDAVSRYLAGEKVPAQSLIPTALYTKAEADKDPKLAGGAPKA
ncbi:MAG TPA: substrate-binding domain-containing protein [Armatimonadota bacterium]|jgi:ribose transport system substrate-binding protein